MSRALGVAIGVAIYVYMAAIAFSICAVIWVLTPEIFPNRVEITSPGRFPGLANPSRPLEVTRYARNPRIARVCADLGITRELGEGIRRLFSEMRRRGLADPIYEQTSSSVKLTLLAVDALPGPEPIPGSSR